MNDSITILIRLLHCFETVEISPLDRLMIADRQAILSALRQAITAIERQYSKPLATVQKNGKLVKGRHYV